MDVGNPCNYNMHFEFWERGNLSVDNIFVLKNTLAILKYTQCNISNSIAGYLLQRDIQYS